MYYFEKAKCKNCPNREGCIAEKQRPRYWVLELTLLNSINTARNKRTRIQRKIQKSFLSGMEKWEMKNFHGLDRARGYGLRGMSTQAKLTAIAVNLKRIAGILSSKLDSFLFFFRFKLVF